MDAQFKIPSDIKTLSQKIGRSFIPRRLKLSEKDISSIKSMDVQFKYIGSMGLFGFDENSTTMSTDSLNTVSLPREHADIDFDIKQIYNFVDQRKRLLEYSLNFQVSNTEREFEQARSAFQKKNRTLKNREETLRRLKESRDQLQEAVEECKKAREMNKAEEEANRKNILVARSRIRSKQKKIRQNDKEILELESQMGNISQECDKKIHLSEQRYKFLEAKVEVTEKLLQDKKDELKLLLDRYAKIEEENEHLNECFQTELKVIYKRINNYSEEIFCHNSMRKKTEAKYTDLKKFVRKLPFFKHHLIYLVKSKVKENGVPTKFISKSFCAWIQYNFLRSSLKMASKKADAYKKEKKRLLEHINRAEDSTFKKVIQNETLLTRFLMEKIIMKTVHFSRSYCLKMRDIAISYLQNRQDLYELTSKGSITGVSCTEQFCILSGKIKKQEGKCTELQEEYLNFAQKWEKVQFHLHESEYFMIIRDIILKMKHSKCAQVRNLMNRMINRWKQLCMLGRKIKGLQKEETNMKSKINKNKLIITDCKTKLQKLDAENLKKTLIMKKKNTKTANSSRRSCRIYSKCQVYRKLRKSQQPTEKYIAPIKL